MPNDPLLLPPSSSFSASSSPSFFLLLRLLFSFLSFSLQLFTADAKVPSVQNSELKGSPSILKAWGRSEYSHACFACCQGFLPFLIMPSQCIHLHFFPNLSLDFLALAVTNAVSCLGPQKKIGYCVSWRT